MLLRKFEGTTQATARGGFTLMELLVVMAILLVLAGVAAPLYWSYLEGAKVKVARTDAVRLATELKNFAISHNGEYPPAGSWDLLPLERSPPLDPWGMPFNWSLTQIQAGESVVPVPVVWSCGPNKGDEGGGGDDITSQ